MSKNILVLLHLSESEKALLERSSILQLCLCDRKSLTAEMVQRANAIIGNPPLDMVKDSPNLEWVQLNSAGAGNIRLKGSPEESF